MKSRSVLASALVFLFGSAAWADVGVFTGSGQDLRQVSTESVQLVSIEVVIVLERGRFLFDGSVPGMDEVEYDCRFVLRNLTDKACEIQAGFPIDSQFAKPPYDAEAAGHDWVSEFSFSARDEKNTYHVTFQMSDPKNSKGAYAAIFTWTMGLQPTETRTLTVRYRIPMSMTLASAGKGGVRARVESAKDHPWMALLDNTMLEVAGYTTETGSSWSGKVEKATFTVVTRPFEQYLDHRGLLENTVADLPADQRERMANTYPVHCVWAFRDLQPPGWQPVEGGVKWEYKDYEPKDPITVRYYLTQFPRLESDVDPWVDAILRIVPDPKLHAGELTLARQILMATYGQEPAEAAARTFAEGQIWYAPRKDFAMSNLTKDQQAVLAGVDRRLASIDQRK